MYGTDYRWQIELRAATYPIEEWVPLRHETGRRYRYIEWGDAEREMAKLLKYQPHAVLRIGPAVN